VRGRSIRFQHGHRELRSLCSTQQDDSCDGEEQEVGCQQWNHEFSFSTRYLLSHFYYYHFLTVSLEGINKESSPLANPRPPISMNPTLNQNHIFSVFSPWYPVTKTHLAGICGS
jgi:hypothetical protein